MVVVAQRNSVDADGRDEIGEIAVVAVLERGKGENHLLPGAGHQIDAGEGTRCAIAAPADLAVVESDYEFALGVVALHHETQILIAAPIPDIPILRRGQGAVDELTARVRIPHFHGDRILPLVGAACCRHARPGVRSAAIAPARLPAWIGENVIPQVAGQTQLERLRRHFARVGRHAEGNHAAHGELSGIQASVHVPIGHHDGDHVFLTEMDLGGI